MKHKTIFYLFFIFTLFGACDMAYQVKEQMSFLMKTRTQFGGNWNGSFSSEGCYTIEITNSPRINNNPDSLEYYATIIGRELLNDFGGNYSCLTLEIVKEKKVAVVTNSSSSIYTYDLAMIKRFAERPIEEYLIILKASKTMSNANDGKVEEAKKWFNRIIKQKQNKFVKLAEASIELAKGNTENAHQIVQDLSENLQDDMLSHYIGGFYEVAGKPQKAMIYYKLAAKLNSEKPDHWLYLSSLAMQEEKVDSGIYYLNKAITKDSTNLQAFYSRALAHLKLKEKAKACDDINYIIQEQPEVNLPDSLNDLCNSRNI